MGFNLCSGQHWKNNAEISDSTNSSVLQSSKNVPKEFDGELTNWNTKRTSYSCSRLPITRSHWNIWLLKPPKITWSSSRVCRRCQLCKADLAFLAAQTLAKILHNIENIENCPLQPQGEERQEGRGGKWSLGVVLEHLSSHSVNGLLLTAVSDTVYWFPGDVRPENTGSDTSCFVDHAPCQQD